MKNNFLVFLKNPPVSVLVDNFDTSFLVRENCILLMENGLETYFFKSVDSNIAYIKEVSAKEEAEFLERVQKIKVDSDKRIVSPGKLN